MEVIVFFIAMVGVIMFWRVLLVLAGIGFAWLFVKGVLSVFQTLPPPHDEWQYPWNLTHGHLSGDELFWTVAFGIIVLLIVRQWIRKGFRRVRTRDNLPNHS